MNAIHYECTHYSIGNMSAGTRAKRQIILIKYIKYILIKYKEYIFIKYQRKENWFLHTFHENAGFQCQAGTNPFLPWQRQSYPSLTDCIDGSRLDSSDEGMQEWKCFETKTATKICCFVERENLKKLGQYMCWSCSSAKFVFWLINGKQIWPTFSCVIRHLYWNHWENIENKTEISRMMR